MLKKACTPEQIAARKKEIIKATGFMFDTMDYQDISMKTISERISIARSSLYCYYKTKEEIMLDVLKDEYLSFMDDLINAFDKDSGNLAEHITDIYLKNFKLLKIISIYLTDIEIHSSLEKLIEFKSAFVTKFPMLKEAILSRTNKDTRKADFVFNSLIMLTHSLYPMIHPTDVQKEAMETVGMEMISDGHEYCYQYLSNILK
ncbi:MAG: TetR/AcrR family transcriptional regulator [Bacilli bacterium]|jgi:AcrR family transcriptional regulator|nr:TetR/AcrR family transcriptional regulator [Bacilli bacterium]